MEAAGLLIIPVIILLFILAVLAFLMPYFVYKISQQTRATADEAKKLGALVQNLPSAQNAAAAIEEARIQNALLRQLLVAYGHTPEA